jgi:hypothetical protein
VALVRAGASRDRHIGHPLGRLGAVAFTAWDDDTRVSRVPHTGSQLKPEFVLRECTSKVVYARLKT